MAQPPGAGLPAGAGQLQQKQGAGQAAAGAGSGSLSCLHTHESSSGCGLLRAGLVIRQSLRQGGRPKGAIGPAEQHGAGGAVDGDGRHSGSELIRQLAAKGNQAFTPAERIFKPGWVVSTALGLQLTGGIHHGQPQATGSQVDAQAQRIRQQRGWRWPASKWRRSRPRSPRGD